MLHLQRARSSAHSLAVRRRIASSLPAALGAAIVVLAATAGPSSSATSMASCGNGIVEAGEQCDPGSPQGAPDCDTRCRTTAFEPADLPFGPPPPPAAPGDPLVGRIYSPGLACRPFDVRDGARDDEAVRVRYRIHLCRTTGGVDSHTEQEVRAAMARASAEFARGGILLEEEALVRFADDDCDMPLGETKWEQDLEDATPPGVLAVAFVSGITSQTLAFSVGGYCYYQGPLCVNAGTYDTLVIHELGHFFGLAHTFECAWGAESTPTCDSSGDFVCDTPPDRGPLGVTGIAQCSNGSMLSGSCAGTCGAKICADGSQPDSLDWMSYYHCTPGHFTNEQRDFMRCMLDHEMQDFDADAGGGPTTTLPDVLCGDVTGDGEITAADALAVLRGGVGAIDCPDWLCDVNASGSVSATDALAVLRTAVGVAASTWCPVPTGG